MVKERRFRYYHNNKDRIKKRTSIWRKNNRWYCNEYARLERERKNAAIRKYTKEEWDEKLKSTKGICTRCNNQIGIDNLERYHIYPLSKAYEDYLNTGIKRVYTINDIQALCRSCNAIKRDKVEV